MVDVFYVKDVFGLKVESERKIEVIRSALMEAIGGEAKKPKAAKNTSKPLAKAKKTPKVGESVKS